MTISNGSSFDHAVFATFLYDVPTTFLHLEATEEVISVGMLNIGHLVANQSRVGVRYHLADEEAVESISAQVHEAWMQEKQRQGFADHVHTSKYASPRVDDGLCCEKSAEWHHPDMLPYDQLPEPVKEYDRATVRAVLQVLAR